MQANSQDSCADDGLAAFIRLPLIYVDDHDYSCHCCRCYGAARGAVSHVCQHVQSECVMAVPSTSRPVTLVANVKVHFVLLVFLNFDHRNLFVSFEPAFSPVCRECCLSVQWTVSTVAVVSTTAMLWRLPLDALRRCTVSVKRALLSGSRPIKGASEREVRSASVRLLSPSRQHLAVVVRVVFARIDELTSQCRVRFDGFHVCRKFPYVVVCNSSNLLILEKSSSVNFKCRVCVCEGPSETNADSSCVQPVTEVRPSTVLPLVLCNALFRS
jgi:hypothetical protein